MCNNPKDFSRIANALCHHQNQSIENSTLQDANIFNKFMLTTSINDTTSSKTNRASDVAFY